MIRRLGFDDNIKVDFVDILKLKLSDLVPYKINYIASSAAVNDLFYLRLIQAALVLKVPSLLVSESHVKALGDLKVLTKGKNKNTFQNCTKFAEAEVQPSSSKMKGCKRNVFRIDTGEPSIRAKLGMNCILCNNKTPFFLKSMQHNYLFHLEAIEEQIKGCLIGILDRTFGYKLVPSEAAWTTTSRFCTEWKVFFQKVLGMEETASKKRRIENLLTRKTPIRFEPLDYFIREEFSLSVEQCIAYANDGSDGIMFFQAVRSFFIGLIKQNNYYLLDE